MRHVSFRVVYYSAEFRILLQHQPHNCTNSFRLSQSEIAATKKGSTSYALRPCTDSIKKGEISRPEHTSEGGCPVQTENTLCHFFHFLFFCLCLSTFSTPRSTVQTRLWTFRPTDMPTSCKDLRTSALKFKPRNTLYSPLLSSTQRHIQKLIS